MSPTPDLFAALDERLAGIEREARAARSRITLGELPNGSSALRSVYEQVSDARALLADAKRTVRA